MAQLCLPLCEPMDYRVHGILWARILEWVAFPFSRGSSQPRDRRSLTLQADSLPAEPPGKLRNTGMGSLSLLQQIFSTQESNRGLPDSACHGGDLGSIPGFDPWDGKIPWRRERLPTPVFWPGAFHAPYSPWGHKESDTTEQLSLSFTPSQCPLTHV